MAVKQILKSTSMAALAASFLVAVVPSVAIAEPNEGRGRWGRDGQSTENPHPREAQGNWRGNGSTGWRDGGQQRQQATPAQAQTPPSPPAHSNGNAENARGGWPTRSQTPAPPPTPQAQPQQQPMQPRANWNGGWQNRNARPDNNRRDGNWRGEQHREDRSRNDGWRNDPRRNDNWRGNDGWRQGENYRWSRDWRRDNRYDWRDWRSQNREVYRLGRYYPPYRGWTYRRLTIGFYLDTLFFGADYWIDNPWMYRLPAAYGPYRWVRYYDDALMVNIYSGEVVDVIYDFFW